MFGSEILDVGIGLALFYSLLAILATTFRELVEALLKSRGRTLERAIEEMLGPDNARQLYNHPLLNGLYRGVHRKEDRALLGFRASAAEIGRRIAEPIRRRHSLPSYIPARTFALALFDTVTSQSGFGRRVPAGDDQGGRSTPFLSLTHARRTIEARGHRLGNAEVAVLTAIDAAQYDVDRAIAELEAWYNGSMDRAAGWYKRQTQWIILLVAVLLTVTLNANSLTIADHLYRNPSARDAFVQRASTAIPDTAAQALQFHEVRAQLDSLRLPLGWPAEVDQRRERIEYAGQQWLGWLITILAICLGAPFWFDVLNKLMVIRSTVKPREKSQEEGSEDRAAQSRTQVIAGGGWPALPPQAGAVPAGFPPPEQPQGPGERGDLQQLREPISIR